MSTDSDAACRVQVALQAVADVDVDVCAYLVTATSGCSIDDTVDMLSTFIPELSSLSLAKRHAVARRVRDAVAGVKQKTRGVKSDKSIADASITVATAPSLLQIRESERATADAVTVTPRADGSGSVEARDIAVTSGCASDVDRDAIDAEHDDDDTDASPPAATDAATMPGRFAASLPSTAQSLLLQLHEFFPDESVDRIAFALLQMSLNMDRASTYILEGPLNLDYAFATTATAPRESSDAVAAGTDADVKSRIMRRYDERVDTSDKSHRPTLPREMTAARDKKQIKYLDGRAFHVPSGQRYIVETTKEEDPSTFVSLKIKRKGARGPGPGWGK